MAALLWNIVEDPTTEYDRKLDAIENASFLELGAGLPGAATHTEATNKVIRYFKTIAGCLQHDLELRCNGHPWTPTQSEHYPNVEVALAMAPSVVRLLWEVVSDSRSRNRIYAAYFACLLEHKIGAQLRYEFDDDDLEFYKSVLNSLRVHIQELDYLSNEQRNNRPPHWPPPPITE